ncbi:hypothetical protein V7150_19345 [Neobacillus drentensis]|uniref:hypothetical protein n=1 Tax=Neobacillus drentensis TaxID=220684 RepID=UPI002FFFADF8
MAWYLGIMGIIFVMVFCLICVVDKIMIREDKDPAYHAKWEGFRTIWRPKIIFFENLIGWIFALLVIYFIYLG